MVFLVLVGVSPAARASALSLHLTHLSVTPSSKLVSDQSVNVAVSGGYAGTTYAVAICGPKVLGLLVPPSSAQDGCDATHNTVVTVNAGGRARTSLVVPALLTTATGGVDCRRGGCFLALVALHGTGTLGIGDLLWERLSFAADACDAPGSCAVPADAWDPSLGQLPGTHPATAAGGAAPEPITITLRPGLAGALDAPGSVTGPDEGHDLGRSAGGSVRSGEGLLRLDLEAPGTSWGPGSPSSTVVDAALTDISTGRQVGEQRFVLFWGARPFVYAGFTGPVTSADRYRVSLRIEPPAGAGGLSQPTPHHRPDAVLRGASLEVVTASNPSYLAYAYAPVLYGRTTSALHDVPLLVYAAATPEPGGGTRLAYTYVFSHEDAGTGFSPFMEYGRWGRSTDIETALSFTVGADGVVHDAEYLWGGQPATGFPDSRTALREVDEPFEGTWIGHHPVIRDATGNNNFSESGTTPFRFQLAPVAPPGPGQAREAVMDANPFTYQVMADELARWHASTNTDPASAEPGDVDQYALVDLNTNATTSSTEVSSVAVGVRLAGSPRWYFSDQGRGVALIGTGHVRTVVKLPRGWASRAVTGVKVAVHPAGAAATVHVVALGLERFDPSALVVDPVAAPAPVVVAA